MKYLRTVDETIRVETLEDRERYRGCGQAALMDRKLIKKTRRNIVVLLKHLVFNSYYIQTALSISY